MERLYCLLIGYAFGLFQTGFIYGKLHNIDIRQHGSGNAGTTNALRTLGWKAGFITFLGDVLKVIFAALLVRVLFFDRCEDMFSLLLLYSGIGTVLGHNFPFYLKFKGGKGIAATAGVIISLGSWQLVVLGLFVFFATLFITKYVSAASLMMLLAVFAGYIGFSYLGYAVDCTVGPIWYESIAMMFLFVVLGFVRHSANIKRLFNGTENKFKIKKNMTEESK